MAVTLQNLELLPRKDPRTATYVASLSRRLSSVLERAWDAQFRNDPTTTQDCLQQVSEIIGLDDRRREMVENIVSRYMSELAKPHPRPFVLEVISLFRPDLKPSTLATYTKGKQAQARVPRFSTMHEIVDDGSVEALLKTMSVFDFLNYVDQRCESGDSAVSKLVSSFYTARYPEWTAEFGRIPFVQIATTLVLLKPVFTAATAVSNSEWEDLGLSLNDGVLADYQPLDGPYRKPTMRDVIDTIVAACKGIQFRSNQRVGAVGVRCSSDSGSITFTSTRAFVVFNPKGFDSFVWDLMSGLRRLIRNEALAGIA